MYTIPLLGHVLLDPLDGAEYFVGLDGPDTSNIGAAVGVGTFAGTIVAAEVWVRNFGGGSPSAELVSIFASTDMSTDDPLQEQIDVGKSWAGTVIVYNATGLTVPVNLVNRCLGIRFVAPAWVTNPTQIRISGLLYVADAAEEQRIADIEAGDVFGALSTEEARVLRSLLRLQVADDPGPLLTAHGGA